MTDPIIPETARAELQANVRRSAYSLVLDPGDRIDAKVALELGMIVLLDKPLLCIVQPGASPNPGLLRHADVVVRLSAGLDTLTGQAEVQAGMTALQAKFP